MSIHPPAWHDRQLAHVRRCLAEADKRHSPEEIAAAEAALAVTEAAHQSELFSVPPHAGLISSGQPEPSGLADHGYLGPRYRHA